MIHDDYNDHDDHDHDHDDHDRMVDRIINNEANDE